MSAAFTLAAMPELVGRELGASDWQAVSQQSIQAFADCTGDGQWLHVDAERCARESPFGAPIAHGFLTLALTAAPMLALGVPCDAARVVNLGAGNVRFRSPVLAGKRVRTRVSLGKVDPKGPDRWLATVGVTMDIEAQEEPALTADVALMLFR